MRLTFLGADHEVTGSCHYIEACGKRILVDFGIEQGPDMYENKTLPIPAATIDYVLLTHAHIDHSGMLPLLYAQGFRGKIMTTRPTADLCSIMLRDSAHIQMHEAEWKNWKAVRSGKPIVEPMYKMEDADGAIRQIVPCEYKKKIVLSEGVEVRFTDIGHLLGSASIEVWLTENHVTKKIVFSGDIGNKNQPLLKDPAHTASADYVVMESTYGDRIHSAERPDYIRELARIIQETFDRGGNLVIPSFAVGRTQEILYFIRKIKADGLVSGYGNFPVYVDSPLAVEATGIFQKNVSECFDEEAMALVHKGINPISFPGLKLSITSDESKEINGEETPKVIISASGMCEAGRIRHHLKHNLWRTDSTILFVGYQAVNTLGRIILDGAKEVKLFGEMIEIRANIIRLEGMSGHADKNGLLEWINAFEKHPERVFVVHGEESVADSFVSCLETEYHYSAYAPYSGTSFDLLTNEIVTEAEPVVLKKRARIVTDAYTRLLAAGQRLLALIRKNEGISNKDAGKFADQINSLCEKWER